MPPHERLEIQNRALDLLLLAARSELEDVSCNAIEALVKIGTRDALPIYRQAIHSASPMVRYAGYCALGELRDRTVLEQLRAGTYDESAHVKLAAAYALCRCGKDGYAQVMIAALMSAPEENVRSDAAGLLGRLGEPRAIPWLRSALRVTANERAKPVKLAIYGALAQLGQKDAVIELVRYSQGDVATRADALLILADLGHRDGREALRYRLLSTAEDYDEARLIAARGMGKLGDASGFDLALRMITYTDPNKKPTPENPSRTFPMRSMAVHALAEIGDIRALPALRQAATTDDSRLQVAACYAIWKVLNGPAAKAAAVGAVP